MKKTNVEKKTPKPLQELTLMDPFLFDATMSDPRVCQNVLSIILDEYVSSIHYGVAEKVLQPYYDTRAVRLDLLAVDEEDRVYDAEAQKENKGFKASVRRSRLYQAHVDVNLLPVGEKDFGKLNDAFIIFISPYDLFGKNLYKYTFRMTCDEFPELRLDDGAVRVFLNTHGKNDSEVSKELIELLRYVEYSNDDSTSIESPRVREVASKVDQIKGDHRMGTKYMRYWEEKEYAREEGRIAGVVETLKELGLDKSQVAEHLMKKLNVDLDKAMEYIIEYWDEEVDN